MMGGWCPADARTGISPGAVLESSLWMNTKHTFFFFLNVIFFNQRNHATYKQNCIDFFATLCPVFLVHGEPTTLAVVVGVTLSGCDDRSPCV